MSKVFELSLSPDNVPDWGMWEGVREVVQNFSDAGSGYCNYDNETKTLSFFNPNTSLPKTYFTTGVSSKRGDKTTVGRHGDGSGSSLCCLLREGYSVELWSNKTIYTPFIEFSDTMGCDVIKVSVKEVGKGINGVRVTITGISEEDNALIKSRSLILQPPPEVINTKKGDILLEHWQKGKIYCGGLFVKEFPDLEYGYNFKPEYLTLDRDRSMVQEFDIQWETKEMWAGVAKSEEDYTQHIATQVVNNSKDTQYLHHTAVPETLKEECYTKVKEKFGEDVILADSPEQQQSLAKSGYKNVVFTGNETLTKIVKGTSAYKTITFDVKPKTRDDYLSAFYENWHNCMDKDMEKDFIKLWDDIK